MRDEVGEDFGIVEDQNSGEIAEDRTPYSPVREFEDLIAWQQARTLTATIFRLTRETPLLGNEGICDQI